MTDQEPSKLLSADRPLTDPEHDRLGYAPFAKHLANSIKRMTPPEGLVMAVYGAWGSGKTSLLNFVVHYVGEEPEETPLTVVRFNPWWFSGHEDLTRLFFDQFIAVLKHSHRTAKDVLDAIKSFADVISKMPGAGAAGAVSAAIGLLEKDMTEYKTHVENLLDAQDQRFVVVIDDIDRLTVEEIRQIFRLLKAIADFPKVMYLLAFDKEVVGKALEHTYGLSGEAFLEKIVQVPFGLPLPDKTSLRRLFSERLDAILADTPEESFDPTYWANVYFEGIDPFIETPRDATRLANTLSVTFPAVRGEVNPVDFIAIESLRVFRPEVYDLVRRNPRYFTGHAPSNGLRGPSIDDFKAFHDAWIATVGEPAQEPLKRLLTRIFPKLNSAWGNTSYGGDWETKWRAESRVCSEHVFPVYFRLAVPEGAISNAEFKAVLALAEDPKDFGRRLLELAEEKRPDGTTRLRAFLEMLWEYSPEHVPPEYISPIIEALFNVGDALLRPEDDSRGLFWIGTDTMIRGVIHQLLRRVERPDRFCALHKALANACSVTTVVGEVVTLAQAHGKHTSRGPQPAEQQLLTEEELEKAEEIALEKVRAAAAEGQLLQTPQLDLVLHYWKECAGPEEAKRWVEEVTAKDAGLVTFLQAFLRRAASQSVSDVVAKFRYRLNPERLKPFIEPSDIVDRVRALANAGGLTDKETAALNQFLKEYEMLERGEDPDSPAA